MNHNLKNEKTIYKNYKPDYLHIHLIHKHPRRPPLVQKRERNECIHRPEHVFTTKSIKKFLLQSRAQSAT